MTALNLARYQITQRLHMSLANIILTDKKLLVISYSYVNTEI